MERAGWRRVRGHGLVTMDSDPRLEGRGEWGQTTTNDPPACTINNSAGPPRLGSKSAVSGQTGGLSAPLIVLMEPTTIKSAVPRRLSSKSAVWANGPIVSPPLVPSWCPILVPHSCAPPGALPGGLQVPPLDPQYCKILHETQNRLCRSLDGSQYIHI